MSEPRGARARTPRAQPRRVPARVGSARPLAAPHRGHSPARGVDSAACHAPAPTRDPPPAWLCLPSTALLAPHARSAGRAPLSPPRRPSARHGREARCRRRVSRVAACTAGHPAPPSPRARAQVAKVPGLHPARSQSLHFPPPALKSQRALALRVTPGPRTRSPSVLVMALSNAPRGSGAARSDLVVCVGSASPCSPMAPFLSGPCLAPKPVPFPAECSSTFKEAGLTLTNYHTFYTQAVFSPHDTEGGTPSVPLLQARKPRVAEGSRVAPTPVQPHSPMRPGPLCSAARFPEGHTLGQVREGGGTLSGRRVARPGEEAALRGRQTPVGREGSRLQVVCSSSGPH